MDNNQPVQPAPSVQQPPVAESLPSPSVTPAPSSGGEKKMILWIVLGLVAIIVIVGGVYFFLSSKQQAETPVATTTPAVAVPTPQTQTSLENDLNAVQVDDPEKDFTPVDQDLQTL